MCSTQQSLSLFISLYISAGVNTDNEFVLAGAPHLVIVHYLTTVKTSICNDLFSVACPRPQLKITSDITSTKSILNAKLMKQS